MAVQMTKERMDAYVEIMEILNHMEEKEVNKIPKKLIEFFERNSSKDYEFKIDLNKPLIQQNFKSKTLEILGMLKMNYWCYDDNSRNIWIKKAYEDEAEYTKKLQEKYSEENLFKQREKHEKKIENNLQLIEYKEESILIKIKKYIYAFFEKLK